VTNLSGTAPFQFTYRADLHLLPTNTLDYEVKLHGGFAEDRRSGYGQIYYGMPGCGILRIDPDLRRQELIDLPKQLEPLNFHSTRLGQIGGVWRLFLPANKAGMIAIVDLDGKLDFVLSRPEFEQYQAQNAAFQPTDTVLVDDQLYVADGYGSNYISIADVNTHVWRGIFGGQAESATENSKFSTAHGMNLTPDHHSLVIADRPSSRIQRHDLDGRFMESYSLPTGSWPCGIDYMQWEGRGIAAIGSLRDPQEDRPAPIYIVDAQSFTILSIIRPKEDLGLDAVQHLHHVIWHRHNGSLFLICQSWNPGYYFVLEQVV